MLRIARLAAKRVSGARGRLGVTRGDAREKQRAELGDEEERAGGDDEAIERREGLGGGERGGGVGRGDGGDVKLLRGGENLVDAGGARVVDVGEEDVVAAAGAVGRGGVEEREEDLREVGDGLVGEAGEEERSRTVFGDLCERGAESPGSGGVVCDVEQDGSVAL